MNGTPPAYGSDDMIALTAHHQWLATGVPIYSSGKNMYVRGYPRLTEPAQKMDDNRGKKVYDENCSIGHSNDGSVAVQNAKVIVKVIWLVWSYNWCAGI